MPAMSGRFTKGPKTGWRWQVYADPSSPTGYTRKVWNPKDASNGGKPTEFFEAHDYEADLEDERDAVARQAATAAQGAAAATQKEKDRQALAARQDAADRQRDVELGLLYGDKRAGRESTEGIARADRESRDREIALKLKEDKRQFDLKYGLDVREAGRRDAELGADILKTGASLRGPNDLVQGWAYAQGVQDSGLSPYVQAIRTGTATAYGGGQARGGNPAPVTVGSLAASMGAGGAGGAPSGAQYGYDAYGRPKLAPDKQAFVEDVGRSVASGIANKPQGFLENMTKGQQKAFWSAASYNGADAEAEETYYLRSRPGQGSALR